MRRYNISIFRPRPVQFLYIISTDLEIDEKSQIMPIQKYQITAFPLIRITWIRPFEGCTKQNKNAA